MNKIVALLLTIIMPGLAVINARISKDQYNPNTILYFFWSVFLILPVVLNTKSKLSLAGIIYVVICLVIFNCGSIYAGKVFTKENAMPVSFSISRLNKILSILVVIGVVCLFMDLVKQGFSLIDLILNFFATTNEFMSKRYNGTADNGIFISIGNILAYVTAVLGGIVYSSDKQWTSVFKGLVISLGITLIRSSKGSLLLSLVFFVGSNLVTVGKSGVSAFKLIYWKRYLFVGGLLLMVLVVSFISRGAYELSVEKAFINVSDYLARYSSGHLFAFSDWFEDYLNGGVDYNSFNYAPGFLTFMSIFQMLGNTDYVAPGIYTEYFNDGIVKSNIYTIFRGLITDFGLFGTLLFWLIFGIFSNLIYALVKSSRNSPIWFPIYMGIIGYIYSSFIVSLLVWKSVIISVIMLILILKFHKLRC